MTKEEGDRIDRLILVVGRLQGTLDDHVLPILGNVVTKDICNALHGANAEAIRSQPPLMTVQACHDLREQGLATGSHKWAVRAFWLSFGGVICAVLGLALKAAGWL